MKNLGKIKDFMKSKPFVYVAFLILVCASITSAIIIFNAGEINGTVTIQDSLQNQIYDVEIDNTPTPCTIDDILDMGTNDFIEVQHNIKNNENFPVDATLTLVSVDAGLTIDIYDGTMTPTNTISIPANSNKWVVLHYQTDGTPVVNSVLESTIEVDVQPS